MATFEITAPDGKTYEVEGATQEGALAALRKMLGPQPEDRSKWGTAESINNVISQIGTGAYKGLAGIAGLPGTLQEAGNIDRPALVRGPEAGKIRVEGGGDALLPSYGDVLGFMENKLGIPMAPAETRGDKF